MSAPMAPIRPRRPLVLAPVCDHCGRPLGVLRGDGSLMIHARSRAIIVKDDHVEMPCHHCKRSTRVSALAPAATVPRVPPPGVACG